MPVRPVKKKEYVIGVSQCSMTDIWRQSMIRDMEVEALNHPEIELVVMDASQDNDTQISQIKGFIKKRWICRLYRRMRPSLLRLSLLRRTGWYSHYHIGPEN